MVSLQSRKWLIGVLVAALAIGSYTYIRAYAQRASTHLTPEDSGLVWNDAGGKVPGTPRTTMKTMKRLYASLQIYRERHDASPAKMGDLLVDMVQHPQNYGFQDFRQASKFFTTSDSQYAESPAAHSQPREYIPYVLPQTRPNGTEIGGPKPQGTRDVLAVATIYYHLNVQRFPNGSATMHPAGSHLVLWADGGVQQIPFQQFLYVSQGAGDFGIAYPSQAGVPSSAMTFDQFIRQIMHRPSKVVRSGKP